MAKVSAIRKNKLRAEKVASHANRRKILKDKIKDKSTSLEERFALVIKLSEIPRNSAKIRLRNRCEITGRPRGYYRKFGLSRNMLRKLAGEGLLPGLIKSSW